MWILSCVCFSLIIDFICSLVLSLCVEPYSQVSHTLATSWLSGPKLVRQDGGDTTVQSYTSKFTLTTQQQPSIRVKLIIWASITFGQQGHDQDLDPWSGTLALCQQCPVAWWCRCSHAACYSATKLFLPGQMWHSLGKRINLFSTLEYTWDITYIHKV